MKKARRLTADDKRYLEGVRLWIKAGRLFAREAKRDLARFREAERDAHTLAQISARQLAINKRRIRQGERDIRRFLERRKKEN